MTKTSANHVRTTVDSLYRAEAGSILATLIRLLGDFDRAEEAVQDAFAAALEQWPRDGIPASPRSWLISAGRFKAIDTLRRKMRFDSRVSEIAYELDRQQQAAHEESESEIKDDHLRLIFTCCHPALSVEASIALTLREVCGLTTEEIARAFLASPTTIAQRIVRAKGKIRDAKIPYQIPSSEDFPERLDAVLRVVYLVFNEGYSASSGDALTRPALSAEAIRLGRLIFEIVPQPQVAGLLALMLLQESRRIARTSEAGDIILLEDQNRSLWNRAFIDEGMELVEGALSSGRVDSYAIQAAIAAVHASAPSSPLTDWPQIVALYDVLGQITPSPIVELNRAVAIAMRDGPDAGLALIDAILTRGELTEYYLAHSARGELYRRAGNLSAAKLSYQRALELAQQVPERRFLEMRIEGLP